MSDTVSDEGGCAFCEGACTAVGWERWDVDDLVWLWRAVGKEAKIREDWALTTGLLSVGLPTATPEAEYHPASEVGRLIFEEVRREDSAMVVNLEAVSKLLYPNSPWRVAWHCTHNRRAAKNVEVRRLQMTKAARQLRRVELRDRIVASFGLTDSQGDQLILHNWDIRPEVTTPRFLDDALALYRALPGPSGESVDRRRLGQAVLGNPHALDSRRPLASFLLDILIVTGQATPRMRPREAWRAVGVLSDGVHDGMALVGVAPEGMSLADGLMVVLPPRTLDVATWAAPRPGGEDVYLTENPSVLEAAIGIVGLQMISTLGSVYDSPSSEMLTALRRMGESGWRLHVRGDFDAFGLEHVGTLLGAIPGAVPWRMSSEDYLAAIAAGDGTTLSEKFPLVASWDTDLVRVMKEHGLAGHEEALLETLLADLEQSCAP